MSDHEVEIPQTSTGTSNKDVLVTKIMVGVGGKEEESDVAKDEKRDTEKPLLHEKRGTESVEIKIVSDDGKLEGGDTPTLPLPERISKNRAEDEKEPPAIFLHPFARIRYAWNHSANLLEFFTRTICIIFASLGWMVLVGGVPFVSIAQLVIGSLYLGDCPAEPRIPEYLIVTGVFGTLLHGVAVCTKYLPKEKKALFEAQRRRCLCLEAILQIFLLIWFIAGCFWVYTIYEPEYKIKAHNDYCNKTLYLFTFWLFNITFIILVLIITASICCISMIAIDSKKN